MPGVQSASPETQISFRGVAPSAVGAVTVTGSRSGAHAGTLRPHSDGSGASFVLAEPFDGARDRHGPHGPEHPRCPRRRLDLQDRRAPEPGLGSGTGAPNLRAAPGAHRPGRHAAARRGAPLPLAAGPAPAGDRGAHDAGEHAAASSSSPPKKVFGARPRAGLQSGPLIVDGKGEPVWFASNDARQRHRLPRPAAQRAAGPHVVAGPRGAGHRRGRRAGRSTPPTGRCSTIRGGNGYQLDFHETTITPQGTLLGHRLQPRAPRPAVHRRAAARRASSTPSSRRSTSRPGSSCPSGTASARSALKESYGRIAPGADPLFDYVHANSATAHARRGHPRLRPRGLGAATCSTARRAGSRRASAARRATYRMVGAAQFAWQHDIQCGRRGHRADLRQRGRAAGPRRSRERCS